MKYEYSFRKMFLIIFGFALIFTANLAKAEDIESAPVWNCIKLLDPQTNSDLTGYERFFTSLFQLPNEYELASETEKKRMVNQWIKELRGNDYEKSTMAAAYLGIVKATKAAKPLERRVVTGGGGGMYSRYINPTLVNCTFGNNSADNIGGGIYCNYGNPIVLNCILWGNSDSGGSDESAQIHTDNGTAVANYCCIQNWTGTLGGTGNVGINPLFVDETNGDYHLRSQTGRWNPDTESWVIDASISACIDAGNPVSDWTEELWPHGKRVNMGVYGGTPQASMSLSDAGNVADLNNDDSVDYMDLKLFTDKWPYQEVLLAEDLNRNGVVNFTDFAIFANNWLWGE